MEYEQGATAKISIELAQAATEYVELEERFNENLTLLLCDKTSSESIATLMTFQKYRMEQLQTKWKLLIGGSEKIHRAGEKVIYNPTLQVPHEEAKLHRLIPGEPAIITVSEVAKEIDGTIIQLRKPEVSEVRV